MHSDAEPRAMTKKFRRSAFVKRPLPSAMLAEMETKARMSRPDSVRVRGGKLSARAAMSTAISTAS